MYVWKWHWLGPTIDLNYSVLRMTIIITVNLFHLLIYLLSISGVLESLFFWNFHNFCVLVGGCYLASSESFRSWSRWDVLRSWVATILSWHQWRRRRLGEKNSKRNLRTKVRNQIKLNFTESLYLVYYGFIMGTNFCRLSKIWICILSSHHIPSHPRLAALSVLIRYVIRF